MTYQPYNVEQDIADMFEDALSPDNFIEDAKSPPITSENCG